MTITTGIVKFFDPTKGFGYINPDDGADAVQVSLNNIKGPNRSLRKGVQVEYTTKFNEKMGKWFASNVTVSGDKNQNTKGKGARMRKKKEDWNKENKEENKGKNGSSYASTSSDGFKKGGTFGSGGKCADCTLLAERHSETEDGKSYCEFFCKFGCHQCKGKGGGPRTWYAKGYKDLDWNSAFDEGWETMMPQCRNCGESIHVKVMEWSTLEEKQAHVSDGPHEVDYCEAGKRGICRLCNNKEF